jgi:hypothetical protein
VIAQGEALGNSHKKIQALKGRDNRSTNADAHYALSGLPILLRHITQGCALGYRIAPLRGSIEAHNVTPTQM